MPIINQVSFWYQNFLDFQRREVFLKMNQILNTIYCSKNQLDFEPNLFAPKASLGGMRGLWENLKFSVQHSGQ